MGINSTRKCPRSRLTNISRFCLAISALFSDSSTDFSSTVVCRSIVRAWRSMARRFPHSKYTCRALVATRKNVKSQYDQSLQSLDIDTGGRSLMRTVWVGVVDGCALLARGAVFWAITSGAASLARCDEPEAWTATDAEACSRTNSSNAIARAFMRDKLYQHEFDKLGSELKLHIWSRNIASATPSRPNSFCHHDEAFRPRRDLLLTIVRLLTAAG